MLQLVFSSARLLLFVVVVVVVVIVRNYSRCAVRVFSSSWSQGQAPVTLHEGTNTPRNKNQAINTTRYILSQGQQTV